MWDECVRGWQSFEDGVVLSGQGEGELPFSVRIPLALDDARQRLLVPAEVAAFFRPGPASTLCHFHDDELWNQRSMLVRGALVEEDGRLVFVPKHIVPPGPFPSARDMFAFFLGARRATKAYFAKRGITPPPIDWKAIRESKARAKAARAARG